MTFNFYQGTKPKHKKTIPIYLFMREGAKGATTIKVNTGVELLPGQWNTKKKSIRKGVTNEQYYNHKLADILAKARKRCDELKGSGLRYTPAEIKTEIEKLINPVFISKDKKSFDEVKEIFIESIKASFTQSYANRFNVLFNILDDFSLSEKQTISFDGFDLVFYDMFTTYLTKKRKHRDNTKGKTIRLLKTFLKWCHEREFLKTEHYRKYKVTRSEVDLIALNENELKAIYKLDLSQSPKLDRVRDAFVFACETGARFSDIQGINRRDISNGLWKYHPKKTPKKTARVFLSPIALAILKKYETHVKPLYVISGQKSNEYIKDVCELAGMKSLTYGRKFIGGKEVKDKEPKMRFEQVSFHTARRTFITLSRQRGVRFEIVMEATAQNMSTMMGYNKITDEMILGEMTEQKSKMKKVS